MRRIIMTQSSVAIRGLNICLFMLMMLMVINDVSANDLLRPYDGKFTIEPEMTQMMHFDGLERVDIGNPEIVNVSTKSGTNNFLIVALKPGTTDITLWGKNNIIKRYEVSVGGNPRIVDLDTLVFELSVVPDVVVNGDDKRFYVSGQVDKKGFQVANEIVERYDNVSSNLQAPEFDTKPMVQFLVKYLEVSKDDIKNIGVEWDAMMNGGFVVQFIKNFSGNPFVTNGRTSTSPDASINGSVGSVINFLARNKIGRVLSEQTLVVESGAEGQVLSGGEFPVRTANDNGGTTTQYKEFGVSFTVKPRINTQNQIHTPLELKMTDLDFVNSIDGNPLVRKEKSTTQLTFNDQQAFLISGFSKLIDRKIVKKVPGIGHLPIFGELFKSRAFQSGKSEFFILVEPKIITDTVAQSRRDTKNFEKNNEAFAIQTQFNLVD